MLTHRAAAILLASCADLATLRTLLGHLGLSGEPLTVETGLRSSLGIEEQVAAAELIAGKGALRACSIEVRDDVPAATVASTLARHLARRSPHALWIVTAAQRQPATVLIAVPGVGSDMVSTLVAGRESVVDADAEALCLLAATPSGTGLDLAIHSRWAELLGREALNRRFYRTLERQVHALASEARGGRATDRSEVALLCSSRLLFLAFLQAKGWLDNDRAFLQRVYDDCVVGRGGVHRRVLRPLFFGTLNTPVRDRAPTARAFGRVPFLNGGLFAPVRVERGTNAPELGDATIGTFLRDVLGAYRFTASERHSTVAGAAVDPEMLGRAFESLMASHERRASGTFYTPSTFVARVADEGLLRAAGSLLPPGSTAVVEALRTGLGVPGALQPVARDALSRLTVLDPACGSGAFLVHALERLAGWHRLAGDVRPADAIRRDLLANSIFGIDRDPTAVWLCELRLWLAVAVECDETDPARVLPLPNLDRNIRVGDALAPLHRDAMPGVSAAPTREAERFAALRMRYARASGMRKQRAATALDTAERVLAITSIDRELDHVQARRRDVLAARRSRDLFGRRSTDSALDRDAASLRDRAAVLRRDRRRLLDGGALPFRYDAHFADVLAAGGFGAVIGNPPWVRLHRIPAADRAALRDRFTSLRAAAWTAGATAGGAGAGFAGQADLAALFVERAIRLLRPRGMLALLVPAKLWTALAGGGIRQLLASDTRIHAVEDCTDAPDLFDAVTYPSIIVAERMPMPSRSGRRATGYTSVAVHRGANVAQWRAPTSRLAFDDSPGSPWLLVPPAVRAAFDRVRAMGSPMSTAGFSRPIMGVKCGLNEAFIVRPGSSPGQHGRPPGVSSIQDGKGREGCVEASLLRPVIRGEHVRPWRIAAADEQIVWTHDCGGPLRTLPEHASRWLSPHRSRLSARSDVRGRGPWWSLHRTEGADARRARVVWADMTRSPRAAWLAPGDPSIPINTCYVLQSPTLLDAQAFTALFNSPLAAAWLRCLAEPARGGYRRMFAWTAALFPVPADWGRAREILAPLAVRAQAAHDAADAPSPADVLEATLDAYGLTRRRVAPLFEWNPDSSW
ncbi:MAG: hypothetical protein H0X64_02610 [Gemmatimonadaceae bacterium]|nr:hypothetical protein [Gemmatimonadaceae bacterium]